MKTHKYFVNRTFSCFNMKKIPTSDFISFGYELSENTSDLRELNRGINQNWYLWEDAIVD